jgi:hypothetical protein
MQLDMITGRVLTSSKLSSKLTTYYDAYIYLMMAYVDETCLWFTQKHLLNGDSNSKL